jgi:hypothetical protein
MLRKRFIQAGLSVPGRSEGDRSTEIRNIDTHSYF